jgi:hypothetical protein
VCAGCGAKEELARHLPSNKNMKSVLAKHKTTTEITVEFLRITATSALLQELLGGKLAATIRAFCRRAAADARAQKPETNSTNNKAKTVPSNTMTSEQNKLAMKENEVQRRDLNKDVVLSQQVYATESEVAEELRQLCALGVFPKAELQTIRETYNELDRERIRLLAKKNKQLEEERMNPTRSADGNEIAAGGGGVRSEGELELEFCKRKLAILRGRRQELELNISKGVDVQGHASNSQGKMLVGGGGGSGGGSGVGVGSQLELPPTTLMTHEDMSPRERAIINAAAREVEIVAEQEAQQSIARARLSDARKFSKNHYGKTSTVEQLQLQKQKSNHSMAERKGNGSNGSDKTNRKMATGAAYLGKCCCFYWSCVPSIFCVCWLCAFCMVLTKRLTFNSLCVLFV